MTDPAVLDATAQAELVRNRDVSPLELVDAAIARIQKLNPELNAVIHERFDPARREATGDLPDGPFRGVPFLVKDLLCHTAGDPLHEGMAGLREMAWIEDHDTYLAAKFRAAGFVFLGRTNTPELGILPATEPEAYGPSRNPWDTKRSTGGSSGGSAAAVASGMVPVAHANDGGGSIRIPASECGLVGLKPSRGRTSLGPDYGDMFGGLVVEHVVSRSVRDTAAVLDAVAGPMPGDPYVAPPPARPYLQDVGQAPAPLHIGLRTAFPGGGGETHPDCVAAAEHAAKLLESLGHTIHDSSPAAFDEVELSQNFITLWAVGNAWSVDDWSRKTGRTITADDVEAGTWALVEMGRSYTALQWLETWHWLHGWTRRMATWWDEEHDLLLTPTIAEPPPTLGQFGATTDNPLQGLFRAASLVPFTPAFNVTGQPAISLPLHWSDNNLPIGVQLVAPYGREDLLIRVAAQLEDAEPWAHRRPPVSA